MNAPGSPIGAGDPKRTVLVNCLGLITFQEGIKQFPDRHGVRVPLEGSDIEGKTGVYVLAGEVISMDQSGIDLVHRQ